MKSKKKKNDLGVDKQHPNHYNKIIKQKESRGTKI